MVLPANSKLKTSIGSYERKLNKAKSFSYHIVVILVFCAEVDYGKQEKNRSLICHFRTHPAFNR